MALAEETFSNNEAAKQYELKIDGRVAAIAQYELQDGTIRLTHTEVLPGHEGKGLGSRIASQTLADVKKRGLQAQLVCSFMRKYAEKHPQ